MCPSINTPTLQVGYELLMVLHVPNGIALRLRIPFINGTLPRLAIPLGIPIGQPPAIQQPSTIEQPPASQQLPSYGTVPRWDDPPPAYGLVEPTDLDNMDNYVTQGFKPSAPPPPAFNENVIWNSTDQFPDSEEVEPVINDVDDEVEQHENEHNDLPVYPVYRSP